MLNAFTTPTSVLRPNFQLRKRQSTNVSILKRVLQIQFYLVPPPQLQKAMVLAQESGASSWLSTLPLKEYKFSLHKRALHDALA